MRISPYQDFKSDMNIQLWQVTAGTPSHEYLSADNATLYEQDIINHPRRYQRISNDKWQNKLEVKRFATRG